MSPVWLEIDRGALRHNLHWIGSRAGGIRRVLAVVKANAYGHGVLPVARLLVEEGAAELAVASLEEALELRRGGIRLPILVLNPGLPREAPVMVRYGFIQTLCSREMIGALSRAARAQQKPARVHVKVDTGMARLGVIPSEAADFFEAVEQAPGLQWDGLFSHFATADGSDLAFVKKQIRLFVSLFKGIPLTRRTALKQVHMANSAAVGLSLVALRKPFTAVRPGLALYGSQPLPGRQLPLRQVMTVKARVQLVKAISKGSTIGYGRTYTAKKPMRIGIVGIGYGHGFSRELSNRGWVLVGGRRVPVVGRVCMDHVMVDVSTVPLTEAGDEAVVIGEQGAARISVEEHAGWLGTIPYVVLSGMDSRVPRIIR